MTNKVSEKASLVAGLANADVHTSAAVSDVYASVAGYRSVTGIAMGGGAALATGKKMTVQLKQATDAAGSNAKNLGTAVTGAALKREVMQSAYVADMDLANAFTFVGVSVISDNGAAYAAGAVVLLSEGRFSQ